MFCLVLGLEWGFLSLFVLAVYSNLAEVAGLIGVCIWEYLDWGILHFNGRMENLSKL